MLDKNRTTKKAPGTAYARGMTNTMKFRGDSSLFSILRPDRGGSAHESKISIGR